MAMNNADSPYTLVVPLGSPSADALLPATYVPRKSQLLGAWLVNGAALAASETDYCKVELKNGTTVVAEIDTRAAHENGLAQNVAKALNVVSGQEVLASGATLTVLYDETDSGTSVALTNAVLVLQLFPF